ASAMKNMLFENNLFTHSGESSAKCAFDAEDGWDQMQDVTFRGNRCVENPVNNRLLTCAGHNFVFEGNTCGLYFWGRTYSPCVRDCEVDVGVFHCDTRNRSGYARFERNVYTRELSMPGGSYRGWDFVLSGLDLTGPVETNNAVRMNFGAAARIVASAFAGRDVCLPNAVGCTLDGCTVTRPPEGRWLGVKMNGGSFYVMPNTNVFERCEFRGVDFKTVTTGVKTFRDCLFENCTFSFAGNADVRFRSCTFKGGSVGNGFWCAANSASFDECLFDVTEKSFVKVGTYSVGAFRFEKCRAASSNKACEMFIDLWDFRASKAGDAVPGSVEVVGCCFQKGVPLVVGCSTIRANGYVKRGEALTKKLDFRFAKNKLLDGAQERGDLPGAPARGGK
ncbi:MAG: hypothetical protein IJ829_07650, partial [Kiritimatiellae bacterium]|nr:hypothetical protein [Kiritimatiellia bacterium]